MGFSAFRYIGSGNVHRWLRQIPNIISSLRILLVPPVALALAHHEYLMTIALFAVAAVSDAADGFLARRFGWQTNLGAILDPVADKLLLATMFVTLALLGLVPLWLMAAVVVRDIVIVLGAVGYRRLIGALEISPSVVSKLNTLCQVAYIMAVIGRKQFSAPPAWVVVLLGALVSVTVVVSGIDYVLTYGRRASSAAKARHGPLTAGGPKPT